MRERDHVADQVLFATGGDLTETGASNFFLVDDKRLITRHLDESFLHGVTRNSILKLGADMGYEIEERGLEPGELAAWSEHGEVFLSGTAAVVAPVGTVILEDEHITVGDGQPGANTLKIREALTSLQVGKTPDPYNWLTKVNG